MDAFSVLILDSQDIVRFALETLVRECPQLRLAGSAGTLAAGLDLIRRTTPDLVTTEMNLHDSNGLDTVRAIVRAQRPRGTLVIAAGDEALFGPQVLMLGAGGFLRKQCAHAQCLDASLAVAGGARWISAELNRHLVERALQPRARSRAPQGELTARELQVLEQLRTGTSTRAIAAALKISPRTVDLYRANMKRKLGLRTGAELVAFASQRMLH
jgi:DNA-binding NarL/FixJ family response regulator